MRFLAHLRPAGVRHLDRAEHSDKHSRGHTHHLGRITFPRETPSSKQTHPSLIKPTPLSSYYSFPPPKIYLQESDLLTTKMDLFFSDLWSSIESLAIFLFAVGMILRFIPNDRCYVAARYSIINLLRLFDTLNRNFLPFKWNKRVILCVDMVFWYHKHLHAYTAVRTIGPKMVMIRKMIVEMIIFLIVFLAFMFAFGISVMSLAYHNEQLNLDLLMNIFFPSFFIIGGNYYTRDTFLYGKLLLKLLNFKVD